jgi:hypothetical protein
MDHDHGHGWWKRAAFASKKMQCGSLVVREEKKVDSLIPSRSQNRLTE